MSYRNTYDTPSRSVAHANYQQQTTWSRHREHRPRLIFARRTPGIGRVLAVLALLCGLGLACWYAVGTLGTLAAGAQEGNPDAPQSTPAREWRQGEVPKLYQRDPAWASASYAGTDFGESGCGPTCLTMAYVALTGRTDTAPVDVGVLSERMGCAGSDGTAWLFMTEGAAELGLVAEELPADEESVRQALLSGSPVICSVRPGDFTTTGHFIVLAGIDADGRLIVRDPNSPERTARAWDFDTILKQSVAIWAYSAA